MTIDHGIDVPSTPTPRRRIVRQTGFEIDAPRATVFPLLCPVRERDWLPGWQADLVYSACGLVEGDCVFRSQHAQLGEALYVTSRYEPADGVVEFIVFFTDICVMKLAIQATPTRDAKTQLRWSRTYTSLCERGDDFLAGMTEAAFLAQARAMQGWLNDYCKRSEGR
jgi:hypothetical protein